MAHQDEFLTHGLQVLAHVNALRECLAPLAEVVVFLFTASEEEDTGVGMLLRQLCYHLLHEGRGVDLALVGSKGCDADEMGGG